MLRRILFLSACVFSLHFFAQNDLDAIRYSRLGAGGTARYIAMGGAFGAVGGDLSVSSVNPAGLGIYRKGDMSLGFGMRFTHHKGTNHGAPVTIDDYRTAFNNFGIVAAWTSKNDAESRHVIGYTLNQLQNFSGKTRFASYTNSTSIARDMLNIVNEKVKNRDSLYLGYEGAGYIVYLLDYDSASARYFSFVDLKRTVQQTRDLSTSGRVNDMNFSYAYAYKDQFYFGASIGLPKVTYTSTMTHVERDDKDSMRITVTSTSSPMTFTSTYTEPLPKAYSDLLGFNSLSYTEYFTTNGGGVNLKLGLIARVNDQLRFGFHFHTPTVYTLRDTYFSQIAATFDYNPKTADEFKYPAEGGYFNYRVITPGKLGASAAFVIRKLAAVGIDYELQNFARASLQSDNVSDFAGVNAVIRSKYAYGSNFRIGSEINLKPLMLRVGYAMQGSPFGNAFVGNFVRHTFSVGTGFRTRSNLYFDFAWYKQLSTEDYYMFSTIDHRSQINFNHSMLSATAGIKF